MSRLQSPSAAPSQPASSPPRGASLARRVGRWPIVAGRLAFRRVSGVRKQAQRWAKRGRYVLRRLQDGSKSVYFDLRDSQRGRVVLEALAGLRAGGEQRARRRAAAPHVARFTGMAIDPARGYGLLSFDPAGDFAPALAACRRLFETKQRPVEERLAGFDTWSPEKQQKFRSQKQSFLRYLLDDGDLRRHPELVDFGLSEALLGPATRYLGMVPYFTRLDLMYSLPRGTDGSIESQLFHLDHEGLMQVKAFVHVYDVGAAEGPFTFIPANESARIVRDIRRLRRERGHQPDVEARRYLDEEVAAVGGRDAIVTIQGPAGTGVAVDTSRCLHLGSRVRPGAFRLCLYGQYCTTREVTNVFDVERYDADPIRHLAVAHSVEAGRALASAYTQRMTAG